MADSGELRQAASLFVTAFNSYVDILGEAQSSDARVEDAQSQVEAAFNAFVQVSISRTGWSSPVRLATDDLQFDEEWDEGHDTDDGDPPGIAANYQFDLHGTVDAVEVVALMDRARALRCADAGLELSDSLLNEVVAERVNLMLSDLDRDGLHLSVSWSIGRQSGDAAR